MKQQKITLPSALLFLLAGSFVLHLGLSVITDGYSTDVNCFAAWASKLAEQGPAAFYQPDYFADYPPGYMLVLWLLGSVSRLTGIAFGTKAYTVLMVLVPTLCTMGLGLLVWQIACRYLDEARALRLAAMALFCPPLLYDTAVWKQVDSVFALCIVGAFWLVCRRKFLPGAAVFGLALTVKPQALLFGPVLAICFLAPLLEKRERKSAWVKVLTTSVLGGMASVGVVLLSALPFWGQQPVGWLLEKYTGTVNSYPYASVNAFNLITLLGGNWVNQTDAIWPGGLTWQTLGIMGITAATVCLALLAWQGMKNRRFSPMLLAAVYTALVFCLGHRMHERYLMASLLMLLAAAARIGDRRLLGAFGLLSFSTLLNVAMVLINNGTEDQFLTSATSCIMIAIISAMNVAGTALLVYAAWAICSGRDIVPYTLAAEPEHKPAPAGLPAWTAREAGLLALITALTAVVSLWNLGDMTAPQTVQDAQGTTFTAQVQVEGQPASLWIYPEVNWNGTLTLWDEQGQQLVQQELDYSNVFHWLELPLANLESGQRYTITLDNASVLEIAFKDAQGQLLSVQGDGAALMDEQELVPQTISYRNSMYFDEIYHGRTAYEHLHGMPVYETTHPPLGKVFQMVGIWLFGMTGFGWRISGVLFGIGMVPVLYLFVRRLSRKTAPALFAALLAALDLMRYAQSRIATIDVYGTFFILLGAYFMVWYAQSVLEKGVCKSILPMALCGLAFGLGAASKWTGIYAGAGLCVLYFGVLWVRWRQNQPGFGRELETALAGGVVFFVAVPLLVYYLAYLPYYWREGGFSLQEWWRCQITMFEYHSQLKSTHPFESRWYSWPFDIRPVWYYSGSAAEGMRATISGIGNPVVWWSALVGLGALLWRQISGRANRVQGGILVFYLTQLLPWVLVTRCTFQYHYFPSLWFAVAALALMVDQLGQRHSRLGRWLYWGLIAAAALVFVWFYPVVTGISVPQAWVDSTKWLASWYY